MQDQVVEKLNCMVEKWIRNPSKFVDWKNIVEYKWWGIIQFSGDWIRWDPRKVPTLDERKDNSGGSLVRECIRLGVQEVSNIGLAYPL